MSQPSTPSSIRTLMLGAAVLFSFTGAAHAQNENLVDLKQGPWSRLVQYIGTNNYDAVLGDADVKKALDKMLKGQKLDLKKIFQASAPIRYEGECLAMEGSPQGEADTDRSYLEVCVSGTVRLAVYDTGKITVYSPSKEYQYLTNGMRSWIYFQDKQIDLFAAPKDVQFIVQAQ